MWDGNRQLQEQTDTHIFTTIYEQDSFEPVARLVWLQDGVQIAANEPEYRSVWDDKPKLIPNVQIYHYHNDHLGTPNELTTHDGEVVWLADYEAYGNTAKIVWREEQLGHLQVSAEELQPIRFQGQSFDTETGLHYNRFRYFDPDLGMFISRDPIGLMGGINTFQYAPNPTGWIDPFGLAWNYHLRNNKNEIYYHGRASDKTDLGAVMSRHSKNVGADGARFGPGDSIHRTTPVGTPYSVARGIEDSGTRTNGVLGRNQPNVRGNIDHGISDRNNNRATYREEAKEYMNARGANNANELPSLESRSHTSNSNTGCT